MSLKITWKIGPVYPALIKGPAVGIIDGRLLVAGGMSYPWREVEYGFWLATEDAPEAVPSLVIPGEKIESPLGAWQPLPPLPIGPGWTSGAAVAGGLAVVGGRRKAVGNRAISNVWFLDVQGGATRWEALADRPSPAMVANTLADGDYLYTLFGTDWQPHEHATGDLNIYRMNVRRRGPWEIVTQFPAEPRWHACITICNGKLYVIGGHDIPVGGVVNPRPHHALSTQIFQPRQTIVFCDAWEYDLARGTWRELPHPPRAFTDVAFSVADRWVVIPGGQSWVAYPEGSPVRILGYVPDLDFMCYSDEVWALDTTTGAWQSLDRLPYGIASHRPATWGSRVYLVGNETIDKKRSNTYGTLFEGQIEVS